MAGDYVLKAAPGAIEIRGGRAKGSLGAEYTGRKIDIEKGYALARQELESYEMSRECSPDFETHFLTSVASAPAETFDGPLFRGRWFEKPPTSSFEFGPPCAKKARQGRYNKEGVPTLYLCSSPSGVDAEVRLPEPEESLWLQQFHLPSDPKLLDARCLSDDAFTSAVFWVIESHRDRSVSHPLLGGHIAELIMALGYDGMIVPSVRGQSGKWYSNVIIFRPGDRWTGYIEPGSPPERRTLTTSYS